MTTLEIIFYIFSAAAIFSAVMVVLSSNPVRSVLFLVGTFFSMAGVWMILHAEFLALVLVLVYVGAVMTLFLFVVMMLNLNQVSFKESFVKYVPIGLFIVLLVTGLMIMVVGSKTSGVLQMPSPVLKSADYSNTADLGMVLYTEYAFPFEVSGILLLAAIIAAISLTHRPAKRRKSQIPSEQIAVRRADRIRLIKMPAEKKDIS